MSLSREELLQVMAYVDGEVSADEMPDVRALLARSEEARRLAEESAAIGDWVRTSAEEQAALAGADRIADSVMARVEGSDGAKVVSIERAKVRYTRVQQRVVAFGAFCAVAAAAFLVYLWPRDAERGGAPATPMAFENPPITSASGASSAVAAESAPVQVAAAPEGEGIDVETVESPQHPVSIFYVPAATGANAHASSVVVWIGEE